MWIHNLNPTLLKIGALEIRYYGLVYALGLFLSLGWLLYLRKKGRISLSKEQSWDLVFYLMLGVIIGSRLFEIFWEPQLYFQKPWQLLMIWQGGMSFHGGLAGIIVANWLYCRKNKLDFWRIADILSIPVMLALALGRIANFINGELVGRITSVGWCVKFPAYEGCRHPSMLYAAGQRFLVFGGLLWLSFKEKALEFKAGFIFWNLVFFEGLGRIMVDFYREDILYFGFSLGQWFSLVMVVTALIVFIKKYKEDWKKFLGKK